MTHRSIIDRVKALNFPEGEYIIIGSGVMDALGLRESHDVDVVASEQLLHELRSQGWHEEEQYHVSMLIRGDIEIWPSWYHNEEHLGLQQLLQKSIEIDGLNFVSPEFLLEWKRAAHREKDLPDIKLLEEYLRGR